MKSLAQFSLPFCLIFYLASGNDLSGIQCGGNDDCLVISDSTCNMDLQLCECLGNNILDPTMQKCLPVASGAGASCIEDVQCSAILLNGGMCRSGKCGCIDGMHYLRGRCWPSKSLGGACSSNEECSGILEVNSVQCFENKCVCADGFYMREYTDCRKKVENVGEPCVLNSDCQFEGGFCNEERLCENISGKKQSKRFGQLVSIRDNVERKQLQAGKLKDKTAPMSGNKVLGDACSLPQECGAQNSECSPSGYCVCKKGFFQVEENCVPEIGGPCEENSECTISGASCEGTMCVCGMGTAASATKQECLTQIYDYNNRCNETSQCTLFGARVQCKAQGSTNCVCDDVSRRIVEDHICWIAKGPGEECSDLRDCSAVSGDELITCSDEADKKCTCIDGYHPSADGKDCFLNAPNLNDVCVEDGDCEVEFALCDTKTKKCTCKTGYYKNENTCLLGVGGPCSQQEDCDSAAGSVCTDSNKKCECLPGWISNLAISACLPISEGVDAMCFEDQQCTPSLGEFSECSSEDLCRCKKRHHLVSGKCTPSKGLGDDCSKSYECFPPVSAEGVSCRNNKCSCDYGLVPAENNAYCTSSAESRFALAHLVLICFLGLFLRL